MDTQVSRNQSTQGRSDDARVFSLRFRTVRGVDHGLQFLDQKPAVAGPLTAAAFGRIRYPGVLFHPARTVSDTHDNEWGKFATHHHIVRRVVQIPGLTAESARRIKQVVTVMS